MEKKTLKLGGLPWWQAVVAVILCALPMYLGVQSDSMTGTLCSMAALAIVLNELGERIPIWNTYIGGGLLLVFFGTATLKHFNLIPEDFIANVHLAQFT
jgi:Na+/citrate or Na+/malate symporter